MWVIEYVHVYIYTHIHTHTHIYIYIYIYIYESVCTYLSCNSKNVVYITEYCNCKKVYPDSKQYRAIESLYIKATLNH